MKEIISSNHSIWIGKESIYQLDLANYSKIAILVDENTKKYCLEKLSKIKYTIIIEIKSGDKNK